MSEIKTRDIVKDIKVLDHHSVVSGKLKEGFIRTLDASPAMQKSSPSEYASDRLERSLSDSAGTTMNTVKKTAGNGRKILHERNVQKRAIKKAEKSGVKTLKHSAKTAGKGAKTAEKTAKVTIKTTKTAAKATVKTAEAAARAAQRTMMLIRNAAVAAVKAAAVTAKAIAAAVKAMMAAAAKLIAVIAAGGWVAVLVIAVIIAVGILVGSFTGVFFSSEDTGSQPMREAVQEINLEYQERIDGIKKDNPNDEVMINGSRTQWKEVLSFYSVKLTGDSENPQEAVTMTEEKKQILKDIFWEMNTITYSVGTGEKSKTVLTITIETMTAMEMAEKYGFSVDRKDQIAMLTDDSNNTLWGRVLYGSGSGNSDIVEIALLQLGNVGGEPYWRFCGWPSRVEWCACFVTWCGDQCGYLEAGLLPMTSSVWIQMEFFKARGQWLDSSTVPEPGMIIIFDWDGHGEPQHVGIVEYVQDGYVHTVEGNSGDSCCQQVYPIGSNLILGYGVIGAE